MDRKKPNLFRYATKELSQDAFICWLLEWADKKYQNVDSELHRTGLKLLNALLSLRGVSLDRPPSLEIKKQEDSIDILVEINRGAHDEYVLLIEDKTSSGEHNDQLKKYLEKVQKKYSELDKSQIHAIFLKTGDQSLFEDRKVEAVEYKIFRREDCLKVLEGDKSDNVIIQDFTSYLKDWDRDVNSWKDEVVSKWWLVKGKQDLIVRRQCTGFFKALDKRLTERLGERFKNYRLIHVRGGNYCAAIWGEVFYGNANLYIQLGRGRLEIKAGAKEKRQVLSLDDVEKIKEYGKRVFPSIFPQMKMNEHKLSEKKKVFKSITIASEACSFVEGDDGYINFEDAVSKLEEFTKRFNRLSDV